MHQGQKYNPEKHHRQSIRLKGYNYSRAGAYFVTICTQNRECLFGEIINGEMNINIAGEMIQKWWNESAVKFGNLELDESIIMPNHFHAILIVGAALCGRPETDITSDKGHPHRGAPTVCDIVDWLKTMTTNEYIRNVRQNNWRAFPGRLWQRNYYEHIIRDDRELNHIRQYIVNNPICWAEDEENPALHQK